MISRRNALMSTLFGAGWVGLRSLATGLPASVLMNPRKALATTPTTNPRAQFVIFQTSVLGDPINANCPGTYEDANGSMQTAGISHSALAGMKPTALSVGSWKGNAALPWAQPWASVPNVIAPAMWQQVLNRSTFWHLATTTFVHPEESNVLKLMDATQADEMLISLLSKQLAPQLGTIQAQPIALGASSPSEALVYGGQTQPVIPPTALKATLTSPTGPLTSLQGIRDSTMSSLYDLYKNGATPAQRAYVDSLVTSQAQARNISQKLLQALSSITDNLVASQITAALALIQMKVAPAFTMHIPFGGDNHADPGLATEAAQTMGTAKSGAYSPSTLAGVPAIATLMNALYAAGLQDQVTFMSLNVFGRTLGAGAFSEGRTHNGNHHVAITIGNGFRAGVVGGVAPVKVTGCAPGGAQCDYGAVPIQSASGIGSTGGDIAPKDSLTSWGLTMGAGLGVDLTQSIQGGKVITGAVAP